MSTCLTPIRANRRVGWRSLVIGIFLLIFCSPLLADNMAWDAHVIDNPTFEQAFAEYYDALAGYPAEDLRFELFETIEDTLSAGSHLTRVPLDHKVRRIETGFIEQLRQFLCRQPATPGDLKTLKDMAGISIINTGNHTQVEFSLAELGMLTGILIRLVQQTPHHQFCKTE